MFMHVIPCGPAYHFFEFRSVFHPCFIRGSRISCFTAFRGGCSIGGEGTRPSQRSAFPRQAQRSAAPDRASNRELIAGPFLRGGPRKVVQRFGRPGHVPVFVKFHGPALPLRPRRAADCNFRQEGTSGCCTGAALGSCSADNGTGRRRCGYTTASKPLRCITGTGLYPGTDSSDRQLVVLDLPHSRSSRMPRRANLVTSFSLASSECSTAQCLPAAWWYP